MYRVDYHQIQVTLQNIALSVLNELLGLMVRTVLEGCKIILYVRKSNERVFSQTKPFQRNRNAGSSTYLTPEILNEGKVPKNLQISYGSL